MSHFNVSLIVWAKSQNSVHKPQFLKRSRAEADRTEVLLLTSLAPYRQATPAHGKGGGGGFMLDLYRQTYRGCVTSNKSSTVTYVCTVQYYMFQFEALFELIAELILIFFSSSSSYLDQVFINFKKYGNGRKAGDYK